jgi:hypothetical protein
MKKLAHKTGLHCLGWMCILFGIFAGLLPFVPGFIFIAAGIYILSLASLWLWLKIEKIKSHFPRFAFQYARIDQKISKYIKKAH